MLIRVDNISYSYDKAAKVLHNISFEISAGEFVALTGHNGSGKSTLVKHLNGLLKPSTGKVWIDGKDTGTRQTAEIAGKTALLFQNPDNQICKTSVWDEVKFGPKNLGYPPQIIESLVEESLELFELKQFKAENPHNFGYSIRKRIAIASIVAMDTPILVFDEPTAGLDPFEVTLFIDTLNKLHSENKTVIIISHDMDFIAENFTRIVSLDTGRKVFDGNINEFFRDLELMKAGGLMQPQVMQLCDALALNCAALTPNECVAELAVKLMNEE